MNPKIENNELDRIIRGALVSDQPFILPDGLTEKTIRKLERKALLRVIFIELASKIGLVVLCLAVWTGVFAGIKGVDVLNDFYNAVAGHWQIVSGVLIIGFVTLVIDQVGLRYLRGLPAV